MPITAFLVGDLGEREAERSARLVATPRYLSLVGDCVSGHAGVLSETERPGQFAASFTQVVQAMACAVELQRSDNLDDGVALRLAIDSAETLSTEAEFHLKRLRGARVLSLAHPGQTLMTRGAQDRAGGEPLPSGTHLVDLGAHRPRDLGRAEYVLELRDRQLARIFPELCSLDVVPNNLAVQLTRFIGRDAQLTELAGLLADTRLLTLTGPGGCGKTRLALQLAGRESGRHDGGVWSVDLARLTDPELLPSAIASALGLRDLPLAPLEQVFTAFLATRHALLVLDNCEHLVGVCAPLAERLTRACPALVVVATSREPLGAAGEMTWRVPSLGVGGGDGEGNTESLDLFADRARAARPSFRLTEETLPAVREVCQRLDGIPLAIELAAARIRALTPDQIATQLSGRFALLTGGLQGALPRHRTLEASLDWSYDLLDEPERLLLRRLSVFAGGFDLPAAENICAGEGLADWAVLDLLSRLVDRSLVQLDEETGHGRYGLLETLRQYAFGKLQDTGEVEALRGRHLDHFLAVAAVACPALEGPDMLGVLARLDPEIDNIRLALDWALQCSRAEDAWCLASDLWLFWQRSRASEGAQRLGQALASESGGDPIRRAGALQAMCDLLSYGGDIVAARAAVTEGLALAESVGDERARGRALNALGFTGLLTQESDAVDRLRLAEMLHRATGDRYYVVDTLGSLMVAAWMIGDGDLGQSCSTSVVLAAHESGNPQMLARGLGFAGFSAVVHGDLGGAVPLLEQCAQLCDVLDDEVFGSFCEALRGQVVLLGGDQEAAAAFFGSSLARSTACNSVIGIMWALWAMGHAAIRTGDNVSADALLGQAHDVAMSIGFVVVAADCTATRAIAAIRRGHLPTAAELVATALETGALPYGKGSLPVAKLASAELALASEDIEKATEVAHEALVGATAIPDRLTSLAALELLAHVETITRRSPEATRLYAAAAAERGRLGLTAGTPAEARRSVDSTRLAEALGHQAYESGTAEGASMPFDDAVAYARRGRGARRRTTSGWSSLTVAELEVVRLVTEGLRNADIAARLFVSQATVKTHLVHIFAKLDVGNRAGLVTLALPRLGKTGQPAGG